MSQLINVNDKVYEELTTLKKIQKGSYSEVIQQLLDSKKSASPKFDFKLILENAKLRGEKYKGKREVIDHDAIVYGVSREGS
ncbi:hypothetical protein HY990_06700 [Candidatus Micrarchaeota archaeon]|nr:hypothetical protein [Candidatus Micrarchaeota archaeon]